jgi:hypothetical protein
MYPDSVISTAAEVSDDVPVFQPKEAIDQLITVGAAQKLILIATK